VSARGGAGARGSHRSVWAALVANLVIAATKFAAAAVSGSSALFTEGIHSVVDTGNQGLLLLGLRRGARPADEEHPFGHGREVYFWSFVVALLVFAAGAGVSLYEGVIHLLHPQPIRDLEVNYIVLAVAFVFEAASLWVAGREFRERAEGRGFFRTVRESKDPTVYTVVLEDGAALVGLLFAFLGNLLFDLTGSPIWDGAASVAIGCLLAAIAGWLAHETQGLLIGEAAHDRVHEVIRGLAEGQPGVASVRRMLTTHLGPEEVLVSLSLDFEDDRSAVQVEAATRSLGARIREALPEVRWVFVEATGIPEGGAAAADDVATSGAGPRPPAPRGE
jgi:cation diffusion facilitator family transporter